MKATIKAVIFDLDGTLLDTLEDLKNAVNAALTHSHMKERTLEEVRQFVGNGVKNLMLRAVEGGAENPHFEETFAYFRQYYTRHCRDNTMPYAGIMPLLMELKKRGYKIAIVSNKLDIAVKELNSDFFADYTQAAIGEMEGVARKPAPDMVFKAMRELGVTAEECIYVGDSDVDIKTAQNAGLHCVSVLWGFRDRQFLTEHGAEQFIESPMELLELVS